MSAPTICQRLSAALAQPAAEALQAARQQPVADVDETGAPTGNAATCGGWCFIR
ncbi:MAG: hypothetical protein VKK97_01950 [Synechococcaceae cyanobacterium]|nr:hypothetical protein [Synechococcaceae cyanobacterium]